MRFLNSAAVASLAVAALSASMDATGRQPEASDDAHVAQATAREAPGLHNVRRVYDGLYTGSSPEGDAGFESIKALGVATIISVDGAEPDVESARRFGLRYVHLPIGYDGVPREQALRIAKAVRDLPGAVYLHCHHGKHRAPAAAAAVRLCLDPDCVVADAVTEMQQAGTDPRYRGLYATVRKIQVPTPDELDDVSDEFPETAQISGLAAAMVDVDHTWERLAEIQKADWNTPPEHPDLDPAHELLQLVEHYREALRLPELANRPNGLRRELAEAEHGAAELERTLRTIDDPAKRRDQAEQGFAAARRACTECHARYRDVPQTK